MKPIGIILPYRSGETDDRLNQLLEAVESWKDQTEGLSQLYIIVDDDQNIWGNAAFSEKYGDIEWLTVPTGLTLMEKLNYHALEIADKHEYIQFLAHDIVLQTPWESQFIDFLESVPFGMAYGNDLVHNGRLATHPCIKSSMIKAVGFYGCPAVEHNFFDNYWMDISRSLGFIQYFPQVIMEHNHPIVGKAPNDSLSKKVADLLESDQVKYQSYMTANFASDVQKISGKAEYSNSARKRKIVDCFPFYDEFLLLDIRLQEIGDLVDHILIVESDETYTGIPKDKPLSLTLHDRYPAYADKIKIVTPKLYPCDDAWDRERFQTNHICKENLSEFSLQDDDIILVGDVDEIPKAKVVEALIYKQLGVTHGALEYDMFYYKFNLKFNHKWYHPKFITFGAFTDYTSARFGAVNSCIPNAGWHFSFIKDPSKIAEKIRAFSHQEYNTDEFTNPDKISERINNGADLFDRDDHKLSRVEVDEFYPAYIKNNIDNLSEWIA